MKREYITTKREIEDALIEEKEIICLDPYSHGVTLAIALARLHAGLPVRTRAKDIKLAEKGGAL